jgi:hypothetical protein
MLVTCHFDAQVFHRITLLEARAVSVRIHLFEDASETYIHNHRSNVISACLAGEYDHTVWHVDTKQRGCYRRATRSPDGSFADVHVRSDGHVTRVHVFKHLPGHIYFLRDSSFHTVTVPELRPGGTSTMTIFVKDKYAGAWSVGVHLGGWCVARVGASKEDGAVDRACQWGPSARASARFPKHSLICLLPPLPFTPRPCLSGPKTTAHMC